MLERGLIIVAHPLPLIRCIVEEARNRCPCLHAVVPGDCRCEVARPGADSNGTDALRVDDRMVLEEAERSAKIFHFAHWVLVLARKAFALSEVTMVERQRHEAACRHGNGIVAGDLLFHARQRPCEDERRRCMSTDRHANDADDPDRVDLERDSLFVNR